MVLPPSHLDESEEQSSHSNSSMNIGGGVAAVSVVALNNLEGGNNANSSQSMLSKALSQGGSPLVENQPSSTNNVDDLTIKQNKKHTDQQQSSDYNKPSNNPINIPVSSSSSSSCPLDSDTSIS